MGKLKETDKSIDFIREDYLGNTVQLDAYKGKKIFLAFFRDTGCTFCNIRMNELIKNHDKFVAAKIQLIAFFASSKERIIKLSEEHKAPFPIIPDPNFEVYNHYFIETSALKKYKTVIKRERLKVGLTSKYFNPKSFFEPNTVPAEFLINESGFIDRCYYAKDYGDHLPVNEILDWNI